LAEWPLGQIEQEWSWPEHYSMVPALVQEQTLQEHWVLAHYKLVRI
jgi:hypothetical protein